MAPIWIRYGQNDSANTTAGATVEICGTDPSEWDTGPQWQSTTGPDANRSDDWPDPDCDKEEVAELPAWRPPTTAPPDERRPESGDAKPVAREWDGRPSQPRPPP